MPQNTIVIFSGDMRVDSLLKKLDVLPGTAMVIRASTLLTEDELIRDDDDIEIRSVISGGL